jgi:arylsulfatase A-like enzyme
MTERPNLVLAVWDTSRADEVIAPERLPGIRSLLERGTVFRRAVSPAPWTLPAHGSLFSGLLPNEHGLTGDLALRDGRLHPVGDRIEQMSGRWLPARLRAAGYRTFAASANPWITPRMGFGLGFDQFVQSWRALSNPRFQVGPSARRASRARFLPPPVRRVGRAVRRAGRYLRAARDSGAGQAVDAFRSWLSERESVGSSTPYFAFFNFMEPHLPYLPPGGFWPREAGSRLKAARVNGGLSNTFVLRYNVGRAEVPPATLQLLRELYRGEIAYLDSRMSELVELAGEETLIVLVGDHGENLGEHHLLGHQASLADTLLRVPLLVSGPEKLVVRGEVTAPVSTARVADTLLAAAGLASAGPTLFEHGQDDAALAWYESAYSEAAGARALADGELAGDREALHILTTRAWAAHRGRHKAIVRSDGTRSLYDIESDPGEAHDLAGSRPDLLAAFDDLSLPLVPVGVSPIEDGAGPASGELDEIERHLQSLGYL